MPTKREVLERMQNMPVDHLNTYTIMDYKAAIRILKTILDEQEKPVEIPQCLADWIEFREKNRKEVSIDFRLANFWIQFANYASRLRKTAEFNEDLYIYASDNRNMPIINQAILTNNYIVKKEQLYYMPVPYISKKTQYYYVDNGGKINFKLGNTYKFTEKQIDEYFSEIKDMAETVEEETK